MTQEIINLARDLVEKFGTRMCDENGDTHGEEIYAMGVDDVIDIIKLVAAKEREEIAQFIDSTELGSLPDAIKKHYARMLSFYSAQIRARGQQ